MTMDLAGLVFLRFVNSTKRSYFTDILLPILNRTTSQTVTGHSENISSESSIRSVVYGNKYHPRESAVSSFGKTITAYIATP